MKAIVIGILSQDKIRERVLAIARLWISLLDADDDRKRR